MVLLELISPLAGLVKVRSKVNLDNMVFKLHYKATAPLLITFCLLVTCRSMAGDPINCVHDENAKLNDDVVNTYCWVHTTYTLPKYLNRRSGPGTNVIHPGIGPARNNDERRYHAFYQWVPFVLFIQGIMFYMPHWIWRSIENGKMESLVSGLSVPVMHREDLQEKVARLAEYLYASLHNHNFYAIKYFLCEAMTVAMPMFNMWLMDKFLGGMFYDYGLKVIEFTEIEQEDRTDPMIELFPRVTKCDFNMFGPSGTIERHDILCVLALNVLNEKIYVFLWFWFLILATISGLGFLYRLLICCIPFISIEFLSRRSLGKKSAVLTRRLQFGDRFVLYVLRNNLELFCFSNLLEELTYRLSSPYGKHPDNDLTSESAYMMNENLDIGRVITR